MFLKLKHLAKRLSIYRRFMRMAEHARELELELQRLEQDYNDFKFRCDMSRDQKDMHLLIKQGTIEGVKWCLGWAKRNDPTVPR